MRTIIGIMVILVAVLGVTVSPSVAWEFSAQGGAGYAGAISHSGSAADVLPGNVWDRDSFAWKIGGQVQHNGWIGQANYVDLGSTGALSFSNSSMETCGILSGSGCDPDHFMRESYRGVEGKLGYQWAMERYTDVTVSVTTGAAAIFSDFTSSLKTAHGDRILPTFVASGQACYKYFCGEVNYYRAFGASGRLADGWIVPMAVVRVPFEF